MCNDRLIEERHIFTIFFGVTLIEHEMKSILNAYTREYAIRWEGTTTITVNKFMFCNYTKGVALLHRLLRTISSLLARKRPPKNIKVSRERVKPMCSPSLLPFKRMYYSCLYARLSEKILCVLTFRLIIHLRIYVLSEHKTRSTIIDYFSWSIIFNIESYVRVNVKYFDRCY